MDDCKWWQGMCNRIPNLNCIEGRSNGSRNDLLSVDDHNDTNDEQKLELRKQVMHWIMFFLIFGILKSSVCQEKKYSQIEYVSCLDDKRLLKCIKSN
jgi:hypothetical protein